MRASSSGLNASGAESSCWMSCSATSADLAAASVSQAAAIFFWAGDSVAMAAARASPSRCLRFFPPDPPPDAPPPEAS